MNLVLSIVQPTEGQGRRWGEGVDNHGRERRPTTDLATEEAPMHLCTSPTTTSTPTRTQGDVPRCRVRIYLPDDVRDAPVVICSELPNNPGGSITNSAEVIAAGVIRANELPTPLVWIEHWPQESTEGQETFDLVVFSSYKLEERAPYLGETRAWIEGATWKPLDRATVEVLVGEKV
jgi:hypothetical protein